GIRPGAARRRRAVSPETASCGPDRRGGLRRQRPIAPAVPCSRLGRNDERRRHGPLRRPQRGSGMTITIGSTRVGPDEPCLIVAELSGNHNGDLGRAIATIQAAKEAGAHAIKLQTYTADTLTIRSDRPDFVVPG